MESIHHVNPLLIQERLARLEICTGIELNPSAFSSPELFSTSECLVAITSSRLGHDPLLHRHVCQFLSHRMLEFRTQPVHVLIAAKSAIEPLAIRAAELFRVPITRLLVDEKQTAQLQADCVVNTSGRLSRDQILIGIADRVDAVYVRPQGNVFAALLQRLKASERQAAATTASVRVAVIDNTQNAANELMNSGAIGWLLSDPKGEDTKVERSSDEPQVSTTSPVHWALDANRWLIHCTRRCAAAWPRQTVKQYQDELLIGGGDVTKRTPFDVLTRIVRQGLLVANAITSAKAYPVVCFSQRSLDECLQKRTFRSHISRWDGEPYGIAIDIDAAKRIGIRPVIYGEPAMRGQIEGDDQYRFQAQGKTYDWTCQQEWRSDGSVDLTQFSAEQIRVFVQTQQEASQLQTISKWPVTAHHD